VPRIRQRVSEIEVAWAAGFFDGEGSCLYDKATGAICLSVSQSDLEPIERFQSALGVGRIFGPYVSGGYGKTRMWRCQVNKQSEVAIAIGKLLPLVSSVKRWQIEDAVEKFTNRDMAELARKRRKRRLAHA
jgi:hypothetical protein